MTSPTPTPTGRALALIWTGVVLAIAGSIASIATGHRSLMGIAAVGFALQVAGWMANRRSAESSAALAVGPDRGDTEEWMGERFTWEPGDLDDEGAGR
ncbi:hypothetical protein ACIBU0_07960 [Streptomyces sp. NPDC049627]|uniref:hypothetical protein n=1 Tax=Streptomyces sp. NPDC049627 TaxID=3365595 RepID=UPI003788A019